MAAALRGWAERAARLEHERAVAARGRLRVGERLELATFSSGDEMEERRLYVAAGADIDDVSHGQTMRAAVNDLQYRLLMLDPHTDVFGSGSRQAHDCGGGRQGLRLPQLRRRRGAASYALHAEAVVSPDFSLISLLAGRQEAHDDFAPGLFGRLAAGEPFGEQDRVPCRRRSAAELTAAGRRGDPPAAALRRRRLPRLPPPRPLRPRAGSGERARRASSSRRRAPISAAIDRQLVVAKLVQRSHELAALLTTQPLDHLEHRLRRRPAGGRLRGGRGARLPRERDLGVLGAQRHGDVPRALPARARDPGVRRRASWAPPTTPATTRAACAPCATGIVASPSLSDAGS